MSHVSLPTQHFKADKWNGCAYEHAVNTFIWPESYFEGYKKVGYIASENEMLVAGLWIRDILPLLGTDPDPRLWPMDPDPAIFVLELQDVIKKLFFSVYYFLKVHSHHFSKIKSREKVTKK
jgi:hypothetical protein